MPRGEQMPNFLKRARPRGLSIVGLTALTASAWWKYLGSWIVEGIDWLGRWEFVLAHAPDISKIGEQLMAGFFNPPGWVFSIAGLAGALIFAWDLHRHRKGRTLEDKTAASGEFLIPGSIPSLDNRAGAYVGGDNTGTQNIYNGPVTFHRLPPLRIRRRVPSGSPSHGREHRYGRMSPDLPQRRGCI